MTSWIVSLLMATLAADRHVEIIAHRGESADAPENTMAAFRLAWERKVDAIELDVHLSKDGRLVVAHDPGMKRTASVDKLIKDSNWEELRTMDVGRWKDARFTGETMPLLEDVLAKIPAGSRCFIEVKVGPEAVPALVRAVEGCGKPPEQLVVISFQAATVAEAKRQLPKLKTYYVLEFKQDKASGQWSPSVDELIKEAKAIGADGVDVSFKGPIDQDFVDRIRRANLEFHVWTVDDVEVARRLIKLGVDGITTNKAAWLREAVK